MTVSSGIFSAVQRFLCVVLLSGLVCVSSAFVLVGLPDGDEFPVVIAGNNVNNNFSGAAGTEPAFGRGTPKELRRFFRWNIPYLVYSFDASFINYFGFDGMEAVHDAFRVLNDFFVPEDGSYNGVTELDLTKHGFAGNFNTTWYNTTAQNAQLIDIKSLVLGMVTTELGIGNPHRHAFSLIGGSVNAWQSQLHLHVALRNYDPLSLKETDVINGVQYAYRFISDAASPTVPAAPPALPGMIDMEEFTADTSGNAWTAVTGILDAFYGETTIYWTDTPTLFGFGIYYDGMNAMGGQYQPRHALTYDDAGGLKYLYSTNTYAYEAHTFAAPFDTSVRLVKPAQLLPTTQAQMAALSPNWSGVPPALQYQNNTGNTLPVWPRRGTISPAFRYNLPIYGQPVIGAAPANSWSPGGAPTANNIGPQDIKLTGGIDRMQFYHQPFDSLLGFFFLPTNFVWTIPFVWESGVTIGGLNNTTPGSSPWQGQKNWQFGAMDVARYVEDPDFIFICDELGNSPDGVPIAYTRGTTNNHMEAVDNTLLPIGYITGLNDQNGTVGPGTIGPGTSADGAAGYEYTFTKLHTNYEMLWSGEMSQVGNLDVINSSIWAHIKGPGPNDVVVFPSEATLWQIENSIIPDASPPTITMLSDTAGAAPIEENTYTRTEETLTIIGTEMASVTAIEIMRGNLVLHTIMPVDKYIVSNTRIDLPPGLLSEVAEGVELEIRVWNSVGVSKKGPQKFNIETGRPVITATTADGIVYDRAETLTVRGYGFKSKTVGQTQLAFLRVDDTQGSAIFDNGIVSGTGSDGLPTAVTFEIQNDTSAIIPINTITSRADGSNRRLRVARSTVTPPSDVNSVLSPPSNALIPVITTKPVIWSLAQNNATGSWENIQTTGMFKRDRILEINGTALNTLDIIEVVNADGSSFPNPVFIQLPNAGVTVEDNGTRVLLGSDVIPYSDADTNGTIQRAFRLYNAAGITDVNASLLFAVNKQPTVTGIGGFGNFGFFNRDKTFGDDVNIYGSGLQAIAGIHIVDLNGSDMDPLAVPRIGLPHPGVTVTDGHISIDTQVAQFSDGTTADTANGTQRILKFISARNNVTSPQADRFSVGVPPTLIGGATVFTQDASSGALITLPANNYQRDTQDLFITGSGFGMATHVEIVDMLGNQIVGAFAVTPTSGLNITDSSNLRIDANATGWAGSTSLLDHVTAFGRRVRITTPFGSVISYGNSSGAFTVSAVPEYLPAAAPLATATFAIDPVAGGGYSPTPGANGTYTQGNGPLVINGANFRGVNTIAFMHGGQPGSSVFVTSSTYGGTQDGNITVDPNNPPAGITFNTTGTQIIIDDVTGGIPAGWVSQTDAWIYLNSAGNRTAFTPQIVTTP